MKICRSLKVFISSSKLPSSKCERSNTSLIKVAKRLLLFRMVSTIERCSSISSVTCKRDDSAMMGVHWCPHLMIHDSQEIVPCTNCCLRFPPCHIQLHSAPSEDLKLAKVPLLPSTQKGKKKEKQQQLQFCSLSLSDKKERQNVDAAHCSKQAGNSRSTTFMVPDL